jgi:5-formyltetrahydrofolate cyclo-ligase
MSASREGQADKAALRRHFRQLRQQVVAAGGNALEEGLGAHALAAAAMIAEPASHLGLYWPLAGEVDLRPLAQQRSGPVALPVIEQHRLVYRPWQPGQPLEADDCGILAPPACAGNLNPDQLGLLLIPALAIDQRGVRLGYGGGWYDRLRAEPPWRQVPALAVLPEACVVAELPHDPWDVPLEGWISERGATRLLHAAAAPISLTKDAHAATNPQVVCQDSDPCTGRSVEPLRPPS